MKSPVAKKETKELSIHNHIRTDQYYWMNQRDSKEVLKNLKEENKYQKAYFKPLEPLMDKLMEEFDNIINPNEVSAPFILQGRTFQVRSIEGKEYEQLVEIKEDKEHVILDENVLAKGHSFYQLASWYFSPNNEILALTEDFVGRRRYQLRFQKQKNGKFLNDILMDVADIEWANDSKTIFYTKKDPETLREYQVFRHTLGTDPSKDVLVYEEKDEKYGVGLSKTKSDKYIFISSYSSTTTETRLINADSPLDEARIFLKRSKGHMYSVSHHENGFYILSNDQAKNRKVLFSENIPNDITQCKEVVKHDENTLLEDISVFKNYIVLEERNSGLLKLRYIDLRTTKGKYIEMEEETYYLGLSLNDSYDTDEIFYTYNSMTTPSTVFKYNMSTGDRTIWFKKELRDKSYDPNQYVSQRIWATANDGTKIPVSILYKKGTKLQSAPCLLYGYGSYGYTLPDVFSATRLSLLNRGFVYAVAHIRGSKYMGEHWYENGKFLKKINTYTDFINCAEYMGHMGYCDKEKIYIQGGSAGGMLMGAVTNMAPYLWKGVVSQVPFVDVVTTMLDESIPLTTGEYEEWGNPNDPEYYYYMLKYSPYDNIHKMNYPPMLVTTGYHDSQVQYWEPQKYVAKLRANKTDKNPLLFECNMDAGHGGGSGRTTERKEIAKVYAFILGLEGIRK